MSATRLGDPGVGEVPYALEEIICVEAHALFAIPRAGGVLGIYMIEDKTPLPEQPRDRGSRSQKDIAAGIAGGCVEVVALAPSTRRLGFPPNSNY